MTTAASGAHPLDELDDAETVELAFPAHPRYLRLARLTASGFATDLEFTFDEIEDLRLAVDEACAVLIAHASPTDRLSLTYRNLDGALCIEGRCINGTGTNVVLDPVTRAVLETAVDAYELHESEGNLTFVVKKRGTLPPP